MSDPRWPPIHVPADWLREKRRLVPDDGRPADSTCTMLLHDAERIIARQSATLDAISEDALTPPCFVCQLPAVILWSDAAICAECIADAFAQGFVATIALAPLPLGRERRVVTDTR